MGVAVRGRVLSNRDQEQIRDRSQKTVGRGEEEVVRLDTDAYHRDLFIAMIVDWSGALDGDGNDLPCTPENKAAVYQHDRDFVNMAAFKITKAIENLRSAERKN